MGVLETAGTLFAALLSLLLVLALAYITIKWMSGRMTTGQKGGTRAIQILDKVMIGQDKCLLVVRVAEKNIFIGMSGDAIVKLDDLPDLPESAPTPDTGTSPEFSEVLRDTIRDGWQRISKKGEERK